MPPQAVDVRRHRCGLTQQHLRRRVPQRAPCLAGACIKGPGRTEIQQHHLIIDHKGIVRLQIQVQQAPPVQVVHHVQQLGEQGHRPVHRQAAHRLVERCAVDPAAREADHSHATQRAQAFDVHKSIRKLDQSRVGQRRQAAALCHQLVGRRRAHPRALEDDSAPRQAVLGNPQRPVDPLPSRRLALGTHKSVSKGKSHVGELLAPELIYGAAQESSEPRHFRNSSLGR